MTWEIAVGLFALVSFCITIATLGAKLNGSITKLACAVDKLNDDGKKTEKRLDAHSAKLDDHEDRIHTIEIKEKIREGKK